MATSVEVAKLLDEMASRGICPQVNISITIRSEAEEEVFVASEDFKKLSGLGRSNCEQPEAPKENVAWRDGRTGQLLGEIDNGSDAPSEGSSGRSERPAGGTDGGLAST